MDIKIISNKSENMSETGDPINPIMCIVVSLVSVVWFVLGILGFIGNSLTILLSEFRLKTFWIYLLCGSIVDFIIFSAYLIALVVHIYDNGESEFSFSVIAIELSLYIKYERSFFSDRIRTHHSIHIRYGCSIPILSTSFIN